MEESAKEIFTTFHADMTLRWPCRQGDLIFWFRWHDFLSEHPNISALDSWSMKNGDFVTITNRLEDIPKSFKLHPTEVCDALAYRLMKQFEAGEAIPDSITDGLNIWRVRAGDSIAWVGVGRPGQPAAKEVLSITKFEKCALVVGEGNWNTMDDVLVFGAPPQASPTPSERNRARTALQLVHGLGIPRTVSTEWLLG